MTVKAGKKTRVPQLTPEEIGLLCYAMGMAPRQLKLAAQKITDDYSLGPRGAWILGLIARVQLFPLDLTKVLRVGRSLITAELTRLTDAGLITTNKDVTDGRRTELALTPLGKVVHTQLSESVAALLHARIAGYTHEEIQLCTQMLRDFCGPNPEAP